MAELGFEEGLGYVPFAGMVLPAVKAIRKDDASPVRATAALALVKDLDAKIDQALVRAASDKNRIVRAAAILAIAEREDPKLLNAMVPSLSDKNQVVRFTAAAAVIRLATVAARNNDLEDTINVLGVQLR